MWGEIQEVSKQTSHSALPMESEHITLSTPVPENTHGVLTTVYNSQGIFPYRVSRVLLGLHYVA